MDLQLFMVKILQSAILDIAFSYPLIIAASLIFAGARREETIMTAIVSGGLMVVGKMILTASANSIQHIVGIYFLMSVTATVIFILQLRRLVGRDTALATQSLRRNVIMLTVWGCSMAYMSMVALAAMPTGGMIGLAISLTISTLLLLLVAVLVATLFRRIPKLAWVGAAVLFLLLLRELVFGVNEILGNAIL